MEEDKDKSIEQQIKEFKEEFKKLERELPEETDGYQHNHLTLIAKLEKEQQKEAVKCSRPTCGM